MGQVVTAEEAGVVGGGAGGAGALNHTSNHTLTSDDPPLELLTR